jgi:hypothetical protein
VKLARRWLGILISGIFVVSLAAVMLAHESDFLRKPFCAAVHVCPSIDNAAAWNKIAYDLGIGGMTSVVFYMLLVWLPDWRRRRRIKRSFIISYRNFKYDVIALMVGLVEGSYASEEVDTLFDQEKFKAYFKEQVGASQDRWGIFVNALADRPDTLRELLTIFEVFRDEIQYVIASLDIQDHETFQFFKRLSAAIYVKKDTTVDYDPIKSLSRFLWELFSGWSFVDGYRKEYIVQKMIDSI